MISTLGNCSKLVYIQAPHSAEMLDHHSCQSLHSQVMKFTLNFPSEYFTRGANFDLKYLARITVATTLVEICRFRFIVATQPAF